MFWPRSNTNTPGFGSVTSRTVSSRSTRQAPSTSATSAAVTPSARAAGSQPEASKPARVQPSVSSRASYSSPAMRSAAVTGPDAARQSVSVTTRSVVPSVNVTSNWASAAGCSPYWCGPNHAMFPAYQPAARVIPSALPPGSSRPVTS